MVTKDSDLTRMQAEVLRLVQEGLSNRQIAARLGVSRDAVRFHLKELHSKLETGGSRRFMILRKLPGVVALPFARWGDAVAACSMAAAAIGLAALAYVTYPADNTEAVQNTTTSYYAWPGATLASFAVPGRIGLATLQQLNPDLPLGELPAGTEVVVPLLPGSEVVLISPTPPTSPP